MRWFSRHYTSAPSTISYGAAFTLDTPDSASITKVSLIRLGAATHSYDHNQRFVPPEFTNSTPGLITVASPASGNVAPPVYYMLFILKPCETFPPRKIWYPSESVMVKLN